jgi:hypothetical protein
MKMSTLSTLVADAKTVLADADKVLHDSEIQSLEALLPAQVKPVLAAVTEGVTVLLAALDALSAA